MTTHRGTFVSDIRQADRTDKRGLAHGYVMSVVLGHTA